MMPNWEVIYYETFTYESNLIPKDFPCQTFPLNEISFQAHYPNLTHTYSLHIPYHFTPLHHTNPYLKLPLMNLILYLSYYLICCCPLLAIRVYFKGDATGGEHM